MINRIVQDLISLRVIQGILYDVIIDLTLRLRQELSLVILSKIQKHLLKRDFKELQNYVFERLVK